MACRKHYNSCDDNFEATAVVFSEIPGVLAMHVAEVLDTHEVMLYRWCMEMRRGEIMAKKKDINININININIYFDVRA